MPIHYWGDEDFDWNALGKACDFFYKHLRRWGRIGCYTKEKYGTMRLEFFTMSCSPYNLIFPGRLSIHPWWLYHISYKYITPVLRATGIGYCINQYQRFVFNVVTIIAVRKWPHIQAEIVNEIEFQDLLYKWVKKKIGFVDHWMSYKPGEVTKPAESNHEDDKTDS